MALSASDNRIIDYEEKNQTSFIKTMEAYVQCNGNINKASAQLYIHRNTCIYRISKIKELFQIDIDDPYVRADILNSLSIYSFFE
ncbi:helix-turn-helix domain-containing protein [Sedimentibacter sp. MB31-C6]|uniref:PucR family transcriptional regulator n=1 Tax=Sedimentibacter sp. MB31-C6 TaxID=3109366 RepID=UPI002DDD3539|nr:helix-turn-helix domain-containing protein [Sedimentibacter sp. MB36-C1]WSI05151.1 helix-turn-helix domain-containing protein [Sedimentibacter sp. MB36-C1]